MGTVNKIPLWKRLPQLFGYPLYPMSSILFSIIACSLLFFNIPLIVLLTVLFFGLCLPMTDNIMHGNLKEPTWNQIKNHFDKFLVAQHVLFFTLIGLGIFFLKKENLNELLYISIFMGFLFLPAILMILYIEKSLIQALNPILLIQFISTLGTSYFKIIFIILLFFSILTIVSLTLPSHLPRPIIDLIIFYLSTYFSIILYLIMGYVLFEKQPKTHMQNITPNASAYGFLIAADEKIKSKEFHEAAEFLLKAIAIDSLNLNLHQKYHELLKDTNDLKNLNYHSRNYIRKLLARNLGIKASEIYNIAREKITDFHLEETSVAISLAHILNDTHHYSIATQVLSEIKNDYLNDPKLPEAYLLYAKIQSEKLNNDEKARQALEYILSKYNNHPLLKEIKSYLDCIMKL